MRAESETFRINRNNYSIMRCCKMCTSKCDGEYMTCRRFHIHCYEMAKVWNRRYLLTGDTMTVVIAR